MKFLTNSSVNAKPLEDLLNAEKDILLPTRNADGREILEKHGTGAFLDFQVLFLQYQDQTDFLLSLHLTLNYNLLLPFERLLTNPV
ncbi:hypothetical protein [Algoriphagus resistens]|uniref:hypothetical protein n=1 Tax=Algoriphagus resistens TaxID=1750590 RepID=UPI0012F88C5A|nr:hypothetical protein [Algoriphagus resistens]